MTHGLNSQELMDIPEPQSEARRRWRVNQVLDLTRKSAETYCDRAGNVWMATLDNHGGSRRILLLPSPHFDDWLAFVAINQTKLSLTLGEIRQVGRVLAGEARSKPPRPLDSLAQERILDVDPLLQIAVAFVEEHDGYFEGPTASVRNKFRELAIARGINRRSSAIPSSTKALTQKLRRQAPILEELGIAVCIRHTRAGSKTVLERRQTGSTDDPSAEAAGNIDPVTHRDGRMSAVVSTNCLPGVDFDANDACDTLRRERSKDCGNHDCRERVSDENVPSTKPQSI